MKLSNLLLFAGAAAGSYFVVKNRQVITEELMDTSDRVEAMKEDLDVIQNMVYAKKVLVWDLHDMT